MISVIVPVYNVERYLRRCVDSIINQTYKDLEIILVDDGSTDSSRTICDEYEKKDKRVKVIHKKNGGASSARNLGLDLANGDYLSFIDSDDWILPDFFSKLLKLCEEYNADISKCETIDIKSEDFSIPMIEVCTKLYTSKEIIQTIYKQPKLFNVAVMNKLYKKSIFQSLRFKEGIINEDEEILCNIILNAKRIVVTDEILYCYFLSENSITRSEFQIKNLDVLNIFEDRMKLLNDNDFDEVYKQTQAQYIRIIGNFYYNISTSKWKEKEKYLNDLLERRKRIRKEIKCNKYFSLKDKIKVVFCFRIQFALTVLYWVKNIYKKRKEKNEKSWNYNNK